MPCRTQRGTRALVSQKAEIRINGLPVLPAAPAALLHRKHSPAAPAMRPKRTVASSMVARGRHGRGAAGALPFFKGWGGGPRSAQPLFLLEIIREPARHNTSHRFVTVAN